MSKAKSYFNILLNILKSSYIAIIFLRAVFSMFGLQTIFFHIYHLKDNMQTTPKANPRTVTLMLGRLQRRFRLWLLPTRARASALCVMGG